MNSQLSSPAPSGQTTGAPTPARLSLLEHKQSAALAVWVLVLTLSLYLTGFFWVAPPSNSWPPSQAKALWLCAFVGGWTVTRCWQDLVAGSRSLTPLRWQQQWRGAWWQWQALLLVLHGVLIGIVVLKQQSLLAQAAEVGLLAIGCQVGGIALAWNSRWWKHSAKGLSRLPGVAWWSSLRLVDVGKERHGKAPSVAAVLVYTLLIPGLFLVPASQHGALALLLTSVMMLCSARVIVSPHVTAQARLWPARASASRALRSTLLHTLGLWFLVGIMVWLLMVAGIWWFGQWPLLMSQLKATPNGLQTSLVTEVQSMLWNVSLIALILWLMARLPGHPVWRDAVMLIPAALGAVWLAWGWFDAAVWQAAPLSLPTEPIAPLALSLLLLWDTDRHWPTAQRHAFVPA